MTNLKGRSFLTLLDFSTEEIEYLLELAALLKQKKRQGTAHRLCEGKNAALIFEKTSTRTRCSFEVAAADLGMYTTYLDPVSSQLGKKESVADTARVLGRMYDAIEYRGFGQERVEALARYSEVPVWNGLTNEYHPTQVLADMLTMREHFGSLKGRTLVFMGDARYNMAASLMIGCAKLGVNFKVAAPKAYFPPRELSEKCRGLASETASQISFHEDTQSAVKGADVIYTDVWVSMGEDESVWEKRIKDLKPYQVTREVMALAGPQCRFMHCLPSFHDLNTGIGQEIYKKFGLTCMEVTDEVFESEQSIVFDEAENRMHTIKAVMAATMGFPEGALNIQEA
ncbi:MAG: ornithine carbamoyltransferase [Clostridia bacterium]|nr:ornithine carbamoyltransferase [Clostridia bacterium]